MLAVSELLCGTSSEYTDPDTGFFKMVGARLIESTPHRDLRGSFEVFWEGSELSANGISFRPTSSAFSFNEKAGTLRGMHYQKTPHGQAKLVSCVSGRVLDVIADLRPESKSFMRWVATELSAATGRALYIPIGYAHGFVTLADNSTVTYLIEGDYMPQAAGTIRWNDTALGIRWPINSPILADRDRLVPDFVA